MISSVLNETCDLTDSQLFGNGVTSGHVPITPQHYFVNPEAKICGAMRAKLHTVGDVLEVVNPCTI